MRVVRVMGSYLPGVTQTVVLLLKQKMQDNRDEARKTRGRARRV